MLQDQVSAALMAPALHERSKPQMHFCAMNQGFLQ